MAKLTQTWWSGIIDVFGDFSKTVPGGDTSRSLEESAELPEASESFSSTLSLSTELLNVISAVRHWFWLRLFAAAAVPTFTLSRSASSSSAELLVILLPGNLCDKAALVISLIRFSSLILYFSFNARFSSSNKADFLLFVTDEGCLLDSTSPWAPTDVVSVLLPSLPCMLLFGIPWPACLLTNALFNGPSFLCRNEKRTPLLLCPSDCSTLASVLFRLVSHLSDPSKVSRLPPRLLLFWLERERRTSKAFSS